jgi:predicted Rossmann fold flavoprotein
METLDIIVIGAGPAGMFASIKAASMGRRVLLLEKNRSAGKKLLMSGSGRCNITHGGNIKNFFSHYGENDKFLRPALLEFKNTDLVNFLNERGMATVVDENGKVFPESQDSGQVLDILLKECRRQNVIIRFFEPVNSVRKSGGIFEVRAGENIYKSEKLVIATGGRSYPSTGSTGDGYLFARSLGHNIIEPAPALAPVRIRDYPFRLLEGISLYDSFIVLYRQGRKIRQRTGDIMLTRGGLSGPGILDLSRYIMPGDEIKISLMSHETLKDFREDFPVQISEHGKSKLKNLIDENYFVPERLLKKVFEMAEVPYEIKSAEVRKNDRQKLIEFLTGFPLQVEALGGYNIAMATRGGVDIKEIDPKTMESRIAANLYFAGEVADIDGDTGGYNLQAAFSTGFMAGKNAAQPGIQ